MHIDTNLHMRPYQSEDNFWRMRDFLRKVFLLNDHLERSWSVPRLDYWRWHFILTCESDPMERVTFLWETSDGELVAVLHALYKGEAYVHIHPRHRSAALENEVFAVAEQRLGNIYDGEHQLYTLVDEDDLLRGEVLKARGYTYRDQPVYRWRRDLETPIPEVKVTPGYKVRSMGDEREFDSRAWASWRAFHPGEPDEGFDNGDWFANLQSAPLYRRDLDIVAEAPNGEIAAFSTIFYDDATRSAVCVLVGTAPEHQHRGLGKAVITEGLRRLQRMGGTRIFANGFDPPANALYRSALGTSYRAESWFKILNG
jgi:ribosomal protein S18 acetylase RimI-like enzyme